MQEKGREGTTKKDKKKVQVLWHVCLDIVHCHWRQLEQIIAELDPQFTLLSRFCGEIIRKRNYERERKWNIERNRMQEKAKSEWHKKTRCSQLCTWPYVIHNSIFFVSHNFLSIFFTLFLLYHFLQHGFAPLLQYSARIIRQKLNQEEGS